MANIDHRITQALLKGRVDLARQLINTLPQDATLDIYTSSGIPAVNLLIIYVVAATSGALDLLRQFTRRTKDLNDVRDAGGRTPAHWAVLANQPAFLHVLVEHKIDLEIPDEQGNTALHLAARESNKAMIGHLLDLHADASARNYDGRTPLGCIHKPDEKPELVAMLRTAALKQTAEKARQGVTEDSAQHALGL